MIGQKKVEIFSRKFRKSLAKQFLEVAIKKHNPFSQKNIVNKATPSLKTTMFTTYIRMFYTSTLFPIHPCILIYYQPRTLINIHL